jgi:hypothetical protein
VCSAGATVSFCPSGGGDVVVGVIIIIVVVVVVVVVVVIVVDAVAFRSLVVGRVSLTGMANTTLRRTVRVGKASVFVLSRLFVTASVFVTLPCVSDTTL